MYVKFELHLRRKARLIIIRTYKVCNEQNERSLLIESARVGRCIGRRIYGLLVVSRWWLRAISPCPQYRQASD